MLIFLNGQILKEEDAKISINDLSYQFGYGLFETIRCEEGTPVFFEAHYKRLIHSAREIGMQFPVEIDELKSWIKQVLSANKFINARLKIIVSKRVEEKFNVLIVVSPLDKLPDSYSLIAKILSRDPNSISYKYKTTSRGDSYLAYKQAIENGFNDVVYVNEKNELLECSRANIFLVMEDKIITPNLESGILWGVTRSKILEIGKKENIIVEEKNVHSLYLNKAKDVFITSAIIGIMPVSKIKLEDKEYNFHKNTKTVSIQTLYREEVKKYFSKL